MKTLSPKHRFHEAEFSPGAFFGLAAIVTLVVAGVIFIALDQLGGSAIIAEHRGALWIASVLAGLVTSSVVFDRTKCSH